MKISINLFTLLFVFSLSISVGFSQPITVGGSTPFVVSFDAAITDAIGADWDGDGFDSGSGAINDGHFDGDTFKATMNVGSTTNATTYGTDYFTGVLAKDVTALTDPSVGMYCSDIDPSGTTDACKRIKPAEGSASSPYSFAQDEASLEFRVEFDDQGGTIVDPYIYLEIQSSFHADNVVAGAEPLTVKWQYKVNSGSWIDLAEYTENLTTSGASAGDFEDWYITAGEEPSTPIVDGDIIYVRAFLPSKISSGVSSSKRNPTMNSYWICYISLKLDDDQFPLPIISYDWNTANCSTCNLGNNGSGIYNYEFSYDFDVEQAVNTWKYLFISMDDDLIQQWCYNYNGTDTYIDANVTYPANFTGTAEHDALWNANSDGTFYYKIRSIDLDGYVEDYDWIALEYDANTNCTSLLQGGVLNSNTGKNLLKDNDIRVVQNQSDIKVSVNTEEPTIFALYDMSGRQLARFESDSGQIVIDRQRNYHQYMIAVSNASLFGSKLINH